MNKPADNTQQEQVIPDIEFLNQKDLDSIKELAQIKLLQDYLTENSIPSIPKPGFYHAVLNAMVNGVISDPYSALYFGMEGISNFLQMLAPTLFDRPGVAIDVDEVLHRMLETRDKLERMVVARYTPRDDLTQEHIAYFDKVFDQAVKTFASQFQEILHRLAKTRNSRTIYFRAGIIRKIQSQQPFDFDRSAFSFDCSAISTNEYRVPDRLGLDVIELLVATSEQLMSFDGVVLHCLQKTFGDEKVYADGDGQLIVDPSVKDEVNAKMCPHKTWFKNIA